MGRASGKSLRGILLQGAKRLKLGGRFLKRAGSDALRMLIFSHEFRLLKLRGGFLRV
jgi:hypothetical protein